jgi:hypothetical protein
MVNAFPTAGTYPVRFNKREAKVLETVLSGSGTFTNKTLTNPTVTTGSFTSPTIVTALHLNDVTTVAYDLKIRSNGDGGTAMSADRLLTFDVFNADRTVDIKGNLSFGGNFTTLAAWSQTGAHTVALTTTGNTALTLPVAGTVAVLTDIGADVRATASVTLTDAQVKDLHNTPIDLIAAPAAGSYIQLEAIELLTTGTTGYDNVAAGEDFTVQYDGGSALMTIETTGWIDQNAVAARFATNSYATAAAPVKATKITIKNSGAVFAAAGDHGLKVKCYYRVLTALV